LAHSNCLICDHSIVPEAGQNSGQHSLRYWSITHYQSLHQDYLAWKKSMRKLATSLGVTNGIIGGVLLVLLPHALPPSYTGARGSAEFVAVLAVVVFFFSTLLINRWGIRKFKREWIGRGGLPRESLGSSGEELQHSSPRLTRISESSS
jgi:hypothetical protein